MMTDTWTWATVTQASPLRIKVDGDTSALDATTDDLVGSLAVDDRVRVHLHSDGIIVTGIQGGNDKVYVISHPESDQPVAYSAGITMSNTSAGGWPSDLAIVVTNAVSPYRTSQVVYEKAGDERQWWRTGRGTTWTAWKETAAYESDGRLKAADGVAADDVATRSQLTGTWQVIWMAVRTVTQSVGNNSTDLVRWPAPYHDPLDLVVNGDGYIEAPADGVYRLTFQMAWENNPSGGYRIAYYYVNRADPEEWGLSVAPHAVTMRSQFIVGASVLEAGDEMSIHVRQNSGSTLELGDSFLPRLVIEKMVA